MQSRKYANPAFLNTEEVTIKNSELATVREQLQLSQQAKTAIIIGAGPGGLASGITLRKQGWQVIIVEKRATFSRSNVIGINHAALGWFEQHDLLDALSAESSKTASFRDAVNYPQDESLLDKKLWLSPAAKTVHTISIKSLQALLSERFIADGGTLLSVDKVELTDELIINLVTASAEHLTINTDEVDLVIGADGAKSDVREKLMSLYSGQNHRSSIIPNEYFANMIITPKPKDLPHGLHFSNDAAGKIRAAISVSDEDVSVNFQTTAIDSENNMDTVTRLIRESKNHMQAILAGKEYAENPSYYPLHGGKVSIGFKEGEVINDLDMTHILVETPTTAASHTVFNNKFILIGDAKGISSPKAGLGASLAIAYDATIIGLLARDYTREQNSSPFTVARKRLRDSISIWATRTMEKVGIISPQHLHRFDFGRSLKPVAIVEKQQEQLNTLRKF